jgi:hypothetical protein
MTIYHAHLGGRQSFYEKIRQDCSCSRQGIFLMQMICEQNMVGVGKGGEGGAGVAIFSHLQPASLGPEEMSWIMSRKGKTKKFAHPGMQLSSQFGTLARFKIC